jgi:Yip1 domain
MLQPRTYPELISKALVLDAAPFIALNDDDDPWIEGMFLTVCVGFLVGAAHLIGRLLITAALPPSGAMLAAILQGWRQFSTSAPESINPAFMEALLREAWSVIVFWNGYSGGWVRLLTLVTTPVLLLVQWLAAGVIIHAMARFLGGKGDLNQTLGVTALMVAPQALRMVEIIPFAAVSQLLLSVWSLLIIYRAIEVTHDLPWRQALLAAVTPWLLLILLGLILGTLVGTGMMVWRLA